MESSINLDLTACRCISATRWPQTVSSETGEKERISFKPAAVWTASVLQGGRVGALSERAQTRAVLTSG